MNYFSSGRQSQASTSFTDLLNTAQLFDPARLQEALGDELWALCQPVGFVGTGQQVVMCAVQSSSAALETAMRKPLVLQRLRQMEAFAQVHDIRICIKQDFRACSISS